MIRIIDIPPSWVGRVVLLPILAGVLYLTHLFLLAQPGVFYSCDGGLKHLLAEQARHGEVSPFLELPQTPLQQELWPQGYFPFEYPFAVPVAQREAVAFPLYFPVLTGWLTNVFGWRGALLLPAAGVLATWGGVLLVCRRLGLSTIGRLLAVTAITLASPLTLYGALYWEHAPATFCAALPLFFIRFDQGGGPPRHPFGLGFLTGLGAFFRPEVPVTAACAMAGFMLAGPWLRRDLIAYARFAAGAVAAIALFLAANLYFYGSITGAHLKITFDESLIRGTPHHLPFWTRFLQLARDLFLYMPAALFAILCALLAPRRMRWVLWPAFSAGLLIAILVHNAGGEQWGPRYVLVLMPWLAVAAGLGWDALRNRPHIERCVSAVAAIALLATGIWMNVWEGRWNVKVAYEQRVLPQALLVRDAPEKVVVAGTTGTSMELAALFATKEFYHAGSPDALEHLTRRLHDRGDRSYLHVTGRTESDPAPGRTRVDTCGKGQLLKVHRIHILP